MVSMTLSIQVNDALLVNMTHREAANVLLHSEERVCLMLHRPSEPNWILSTQISPSSSLSSPTHFLPSSASSPADLSSLSSPTHFSSPAHDHIMETPALDVSPIEEPIIEEASPTEEAGVSVEEVMVSE